MHTISARRGNRQISVETWVDQNGRVVRFNLVYINHAIFVGDHGRVLGYDSQHGRHHRHDLGAVTDVALETSEEIETLFEHELHTLLKGGTL